MKTLLSLLVSITSASLWLTPDQEGMFYYNRGEFIPAAEAFLDPEWQGASWYKAGEFNKAAQAFSRRDTAEANYNQGNALLMHGKYEQAITRYDTALQKKPDWPEAKENREIAAARAAMVEKKGGDMTGGQLGADDIVFDNNAKKSEETEDVGGGEAPSNQEIQAIWLRRVQTRPADFLKAKFAFQQRFQAGGENK